MDNVQSRLSGCFQTVFPDLPEGEIVAASQQSVSQWDSIAAITLMNVIEEEFNIPVDFDRLAELDSFASIQLYLEQQAHS